MKHVVILGTGFAGLEAAICLCKEGYHVTLVSERDFFFVSPTSIWIPFRTLEFDTNCIDLRKLQRVHGFDLTIGRVTSIRARAGEICLENGEKITGYDHLIVAMGMGKIALPGMEHTLSICGPIDMFFSRMNIHRRVGTKIKEFAPGAVAFADDSRLEADFIMYIPGGRGHHVLIDSDLPTTEAGFVRIDDQCRVAFGQEEGPNNIYVIGDSAALEGPDWRAKQGHIAEVMARTAAFNIIAADAKRPERRGHRDHLNVLCVMDSGNSAAFVYRDHKRGLVFPMPYLGHGLKKGWLHYFRLSKLNKIPRLPGM